MKKIIRLLCVLTFAVFASFLAVNSTKESKVTGGYFSADINIPKIHSYKEKCEALVEKSTPVEELGYYTDRILVKYTVSNEQLDNIARKLGGYFDGQIYEYLDNSKAGIIKINSEVTTKTAIKEFLDNNGILIADKSLVITPYDIDKSKFTNIDPAFDEGRAYHLLDGKGGANVVNAWDTVSENAVYKPKVAVLDTGADITHPDLRNNLNLDLSKEVVKNNETKEFETVPLLGDGIGVEDVNKKRQSYAYHGSHTAGIVGMEANNGLGSVGVASGYDNSFLEVFSVDVFSDTTGSTDYICAGIEYAIEAGADVINMSLGGTSYNSVKDNDENSLMGSVCKDAYDRGITVVASAGNTGKESNSTNGWNVPGALSTTIGIIACNSDGAVANYSTWGDDYDLTAPGSGVYSTVPNASHMSASGTSMSAPVVSGVVALLYSIKPNITPAEVRDILNTTARDILQKGRDSKSGYGIIDATKAVKKLLELYRVRFYDKNNNLISQSFTKGKEYITYEKDLPDDEDGKFAGWSLEEEPDKFLYKLRPVYIDIQSKKYDGNEVELKTNFNEGNIETKYRLKESDESYTSGLPKDIGSYEVICSVKGDGNYKQLSFDIKIAEELQKVVFKAGINNEKTVYECDEINIPSNEYLFNLEGIEVDGYTFLGWYDDSTVDTQDTKYMKAVYIYIDRVTEYNNTTTPWNYILNIPDAVVGYTYKTELDGELLQGMPTNSPDNNSSYDIYVFPVMESSGIWTNKYVKATCVTSPCLEFNFRVGYNNDINYRKVMVAMNQADNISNWFETQTYIKNPETYCKPTGYTFAGWHMTEIVDNKYYFDAIYVSTSYSNDSTGINVDVNYKNDNLRYVLESKEYSTINDFPKETFGEDIYSVSFDIKYNKNIYDYRGSFDIRFKNPSEKVKNALGEGSSVSFRDFNDVPFDIKHNIKSRSEIVYPTAPPVNGYEFLGYLGDDFKAGGEDVIFESVYVKVTDDPNNTSSINIDTNIKNKNSLLTYYKKVGDEKFTYGLPVFDGTYEIKVVVNGRGYFQSDNIFTVEVVEFSTSSNKLNNKTSLNELSKIKHTKEQIKEAKLENKKSVNELGFYPRQILVSYTAKEEYVKSVAQTLGGVFRSKITEFNNGVSVALISISNETTVSEAIKEYTKAHGIINAQQNNCYETFAVDSYEVNDPYYKYSYYLKNDDKKTTRGSSAEGAWSKLGGQTLNKVKVVVLDTGCQMYHPDLRNIVNKEDSVEVVFNEETGKYSYGKLYGDGVGIDDIKNKDISQYHGTHVSGIIAAESNNRSGSAGVASYANSIVELINVDVVEGVDVSDDKLLSGLSYAKSKNADVVNLSLGDKIENNKNNVLIEQMCNDLRDSGTTIVAAAGNVSSEYNIKATDIIEPGCYESTIGVINTESNGNVSNTSCYGSHLDVCAPGTDILSTNSNGSYIHLTGTSMATPVVTGAVAIIKSLNPNLTPVEIKQIIRNSATDLYQTGIDEKSACGLLNISAAVDSVLTDKSGKSLTKVNLYNEGVHISTQFVSSKEGIEYPEVSKEGYELLGWLGDVDSIGSSKTEINLNAVYAKVNSQTTSSKLDVTLVPNIANYNVLYKNSNEQSYEYTTGIPSLAGDYNIKININETGVWKDVVFNIRLTEQFRNIKFMAGLSSDVLVKEVNNIQTFDSFDYPSINDTGVAVDGYKFMGWLGDPKESSEKDIEIKAIYAKIDNKKSDGAPLVLDTNYTGNNISYMITNESGETTSSTSLPKEIGYYKIKVIFDEAGKWNEDIIFYAEIITSGASFYNLKIRAGLNSEIDLGVRYNVTDKFINLDYLPDISNLPIEDGYHFFGWRLFDYSGNKDRTVRAMYVRIQSRSEGNTVLTYDTNYTGSGLRFTSTDKVTGAVDSRLPRTAGDYSIGVTVMESIRGVFKECNIDAHISSTVEEVIIKDKDGNILLDKYAYSREDVSYPRPGVDGKLLIGWLGEQYNIGYKKIELSPVYIDDPEKEYDGKELEINTNYKGNRMEVYYKKTSESEYTKGKPKEIGEYNILVRIYDAGYWNNNIIKTRIFGTKAIFNDKEKREIKNYRQYDFGTIDKLNYNGLSNYDDYIFIGWDKNTALSANGVYVFDPIFVRDKIAVYTGKPITIESKSFHELNYSYRTDGSYDAFTSGLPTEIGSYEIIVEASRSDQKILNAVFKFLVQKKLYKAIYKDEKNNVVSSYEVDNLNTLEIPEAAKSGYTLIGWQGEVSKLTEKDVELRPKYIKTDTKVTVNQIHIDTNITNLSDIRAYYYGRTRQGLGLPSVPGEYSIEYNIEDTLEGVWKSNVSLDYTIFYHPLTFRTGLSESEIARYFDITDTSRIMAPSGKEEEGYYNLGYIGNRALLETGPTDFKSVYAKIEVKNGKAVLISNTNTANIDVSYMKYGDINNNKKTGLPADEGLYEITICGKKSIDGIWNSPIKFNLKIDGDLNDVTFVGYDNEVISKQENISSSSEIVIPQAKEVEGMVFKGWQGNVEDITVKDVVMKAIYIGCDSKVYDGYPLKVKTNYSGNNLTWKYKELHSNYSDNKTGIPLALGAYNISLDINETGIWNDAIIRADMLKNKKEVNYKDPVDRDYIDNLNQKVLDKKEINHTQGTGVDGYNFVGWTQVDSDGIDYSSITYDGIYVKTQQKVYLDKEYPITLLNDIKGLVFSEITYKNTKTGKTSKTAPSEVGTYEVSCEITDQYGVEFEYVANTKYTVNNEILFLDINGNKMEGSTLNDIYDTSEIVFPDAYEVDGFKFIGWEGEIPEFITSDITFKSIYVNLSSVNFNGNPVKPVFNYSDIGDVDIQVKEQTQSDDSYQAGLPILPGDYTVKILEFNDKEVKIINNTFDITVNTGKLDKVDILDTISEYDGLAHSARIEIGDIPYTDFEIKYGIVEGIYNKDIIEITSVSESVTVYFEITEKNGYYDTFYGSYKLIINNAKINAKISGYGGKIDGLNHHINLSEVTTKANQEATIKYSNISSVTMPSEDTFVLDEPLEHADEGHYVDWVRISALNHETLYLSANVILNSTSHTATYLDKDGNVIEEATQENVYGESELVFPKPSEHEGYTFMGWAGTKSDISDMDVAFRPVYITTPLDKYIISVDEFLLQTNIQNATITYKFVDKEQNEYDSIPEIEGTYSVYVTVQTSEDNTFTTVFENVKFEEYVDNTSIYRLYNPHTGEHLFTSKENEYKKLGTIGWTLEGVSFDGYVSTNKPDDAVAIYRLFNPNGFGGKGDHHYTKSTGEVEKLQSAGWKIDFSGEPAFYVNGTITVYKLYDKKTGAHHYTPKSGEKDKMSKAGWTYEGVAWYVNGYYTADGTRQTGSNN